MSNPKDVRHVVVDLLDDVTIEKRLLSEVLPKRLAKLPAEDRARAQRLVIQTLRDMDRCDRMLGPFLRQRPVPRVLNVLRLGVSEICNGGAAHGVVNACVEIAKAQAETEHARGLVNAVLRKIDREKDKWDTLPIPRLPKWLRKPLLADYGKEAVAAMEEAQFAGAPVDLTAKGDVAALAKAVKGTQLPTGSVRLSDAGQITNLPGYAEGDWWVQDAAAALPAKVLAAQAGETILDMCAAPGGKTMQLAAAGAAVTALDVSEGRMTRVEENLTRTKLSAELVTRDALEFEGGPFDAILLDAPCTATGTIRRHPDLPYAKDGGEFPGLFELQEHMIDRALGLLKPGGRLVYCTCSLLIDEGEEQVRDALARHEGLAVDHDALRLPGVEADWIGPEGLRLFPHYMADQGGMDGFFITCLRRK
ncbi:16S rRNA (cytosine967-C5)-methyltransferase [Aliiroseovarius halocynthiae]|uniref:Methyltransferase domain-containing protein n=1 Tax=Aliiroseovarius halocynthiae TaxID=985055 RepID=A0A545SP72_9RHOB|nr:RsmB/NOP family class I SAM-dependent RNA methyltransferase [Aliiroseovarius halocynthiae]TQV66780.1 methyltransferase domain-containing protein [Aliiroseovarius halocynthiae]SMR82392.1 16S rRNA (cytosine967-C5)-methyltransferase [Aliiroseovarius halocynthiae]